METLTGSCPWTVTGARIWSSTPSAWPEVLTVGGEEEDVPAGAAGQVVAHLIIDALNLEDIAAGVPVDGEVIDAGVRNRGGRGVADGLEALPQEGDQALLADDVLIHDLSGKGGRVVGVGRAQRVSRWVESPDPDGGVVIYDG